MRVFSVTREFAAFHENFEIDVKWYSLRQSEAVNSFYPFISGAL